MKKYLLLAVVILTSAMVYAQSGDDAIVIKGTKKVGKKMTPQQVLDSLHKRFPDAKAIETYKVGSADTKKGWDVTKEDEMMVDEEIDYYTIAFKNGSMQYYGLYDKDGNLLKCRMEETVDKLPDNVVASLKELGKQYPGYKVISKNYYKNQNYSKNEEYYEVIASDGKNKKRVFYSADGTLIKVKG